MKFSKVVILGFFTWLIPFLASFFFYSKEGQLVIDPYLFKSIMIIVGSFSASALIVQYFKGVKKHYLRAGAMVGFVWLGMNLFLDLIILVPMSGMSVLDYVSQIGMRYLSILAMTLAVGGSIDGLKSNKSSKSKKK